MQNQTLFSNSGPFHSELVASRAASIGIRCTVRLVNYAKYEIELKNLCQYYVCVETHRFVSSCLDCDVINKIYKTLFN